MARSGTAGTQDDNGAAPGRAARRTTRKEFRRQSILDAAAIEFAESGYDQATLDQIGERVGLSKASLYYYVSGKEQLFAAIVDQFVDGIELEVAEAMRSGDAIAGLEALVRGHLSAASIPMGRALAVNLHALRGAEPRLGAARYERLVAGIIEQGMSSGQIRTVPVRPAVKLVIGAMNGVSQWFKPDGKLPLEDVVTGVVGVLLSGVERDAGLRGAPGVP